MKRNIVVIAVLVLGICCFSGMTVGAAQNETQEDGWEESEESQAESEESLTESEESLTENEESSTESGESQAENEESRTESGESLAESEESLTEDENGRKSEEPQPADGKRKEQKLCSLEIPQKLGVIIDPWEMDGRGQIYSEQYVIKNTGDVTGILTLTFVCRKGEDSTAVIRTDTAGLHDDKNKSIYIEMIFGDADRMVLTEEGVEYQVHLQPGEDLSVSFAGEANEYASESWGDGDVEIEGVYSWNTLENTYPAEEESIQDISSEESKEQKAVSEESGGEEEASDESKNPEDPSKESDRQDVSSEESVAQDVSAEGNGLQDIEESNAEEKILQEGQQGASGEEDTDKDSRMRTQEETDEST